MLVWAAFTHSLANQVLPPTPSVICLRKSLYKAPGLALLPVCDLSLADAEKDPVLSTLLYVPSLLIAAAVTVACVSASHLLIWRGARDEVSVLVWGAAYGLCTLAMILVGLRGDIPAFLSIVVSNTLLLVAVGLFWLGYRRFIGKIGRHDLLLALLGGIVWLAFACNRQFFADINARIHVVSAIQSIYLLVVAIDLIDHKRKEALPALSLTVAAIAVQQALLIVRTVHLLIAPLDPDATTLPSGTPLAVTLIGSIGFVVFLGLVQLALVGQRSERRYRIAAETDGLTGLANRRRFLRKVLSHLNGNPDRGTLVLFDLDYFKRVNDTHGHLTGDRALVEFAGILAGATPEGAVVARIGGEEFALFLPDSDATTAAVLAEGIRQLTQAFELGTASGSLRITVSVGIADIAEAGTDYEMLHGAADVALYQAKREGRDRVAVYRWEPPQKPIAAQGHVGLDQLASATA
ncbi:GGDEF domain-containing protein [Pleomorphomonas sp. JP5]|uniref:GGDEF domain-containing protein n=1 Tax=Pleomorphomonas sp. JP5 TaxID=2942998 RepID=UPI002042FC25|nr:GGDEF domain-containing protein [Pleomorphomonas sp. JP5]MCM5556144.1 GGDEF domain-containing protein [Pleomorphomonas sp. JP5]